MTNYENMFREAGYERIIEVAETVLLKPIFLSKVKLNAYKVALENILEDYKNDKIYEYYYSYDDTKFGFCEFSKWNG